MSKHEGLILDRPHGEPSAPDHHPTLRLASGREARLSQGPDDDLLVVTAPDGRIELRIRFTDHGPVLDFEAIALRLASTGDVSVQCGKFKVAAADSIQMTSAGDIVQEAGGDLSSHAAGKAHLDAHAVEVQSRRGNVDLKANDDVCLNGERIKLNC